MCIYVPLVQEAHTAYDTMFPPMPPLKLTIKTKHSKYSSVPYAKRLCEAVMTENRLLQLKITWIIDKCVDLILFD